ncbi:proton-coupled amino acid transporter 1-like [Rhodnius prolixus]|uniref:proton-coupled amino acid transporter 1-like n=1 Tax=Rhodnius prolixus TaxID=13249 RepID=UPI003D188C1D
MDLHVDVPKSSQSSRKDLKSAQHSANSIRSAHSTIRRTTYVESLIHLLKACICSGTFAMGDAMKNAGLVLGPIGITLLGAICIYNNQSLVRSSVVIRKKLCLLHEPNFPEIVELCFEYGPLRFRKWRNFVRYIVKIFIIATQLGFCSVYFVFVASTMQTVMEKHGFQYDTRIYISIALLPILLSSMIRSLKLLTPLSLLSNMCIFFGIFMTAYQCCMDLPSLSERKLVTDYASWPLFLGTTLYNFEGISIVIPLLNEMKDTRRFSSPFGVLNVGLTMVVLLAVIMGFLTYLKFGDDVRGSFTLNLDQGILSEMIMSIVALGILLTYPIQFHVAVDVFWWDLVASFGPFKHMVLYELLLRTVLVLITFVMAAVVPRLNLFISLIGAVCSTTLSLVLPALCDISLRACPEDEGRLMASSKCNQVFRYLMNGISLFLAAIASTTGAFYSIKTIIAVFWQDELGKYT